MEIASLDKRIQILKVFFAGTDAEGFETEEKEELIRECWAKMTQTSGTELVKSGAEFAESKVRFLIRYTPVRIDTDMMVRYDGQDYDIQYINTYGDNHRYTEIWTQRRELV